MIVSWKNIKTNEVKVNVQRREVYEETFSIEFLFDALSDASWLIEEHDRDSVTLSTRDTAAIRHALEVMEYTESDTINVSLNGDRVEAEVSIINEQSRMLFHLDLEVFDMELIEDETTMELI